MLWDNTVNEIISRTRILVITLEIPGQFIWVSTYLLPETQIPDFEIFDNFDANLISAILGVVGKNHLEKYLAAILDHQSLSCLARRES